MVPYTDVPSTFTQARKQGFSQVMSSPPSQESRRQTSYSRCRPLSAPATCDALLHAVVSALPPPPE
ncbi:hypothetical protein BDV12DRAFT_180133 [Aspergillus spectabilis]